MKKPTIYTTFQRCLAVLANISPPPRVDILNPFLPRPNVRCFFGVTCRILEKRGCLSTCERVGVVTFGKGGLRYKKITARSPVLGRRGKRRTLSPRGDEMCREYGSYLDGQHQSGIWFLGCNVGGIREKGGGMFHLLMWMFGVVLQVEVIGIG